MNYRRLGRSGLKVSPLCLGAMMFGDQTSEADSLEIIASARDAGVNFIDTADAYSAGRAEQIVEEEQQRSIVREALASLPEKERKLLELYYFEERSLLEAGAALGLSKSWSSRLHARAVTLLKEALQRGGAMPTGDGDEDAGFRPGRARR